jgi:hypothetical protein
MNLKELGYENVAQNKKKMFLRQRIKAVVAFGVIPR